jgi:hypothetical protein
MNVEKGEFACPRSCVWGSVAFVFNNNLTILSGKAHLFSSFHFLGH